MTSDVFQKSLKAWGIRQCLSAAYNPHSNCRAELAVKTGKRLLRDNVGPGATLNTDRFMRAVMQFRNTPMQDCRRSPAQMVFGRAMRDFIPSMPHKYEPAKDWVVTQEYRERTLALKREADHKRWSQKTKNLGMLEVGTPVMIQNQTGNNPTKWDKTGVVLENKPHSQVLVRVDGSRRVTLRNRRFIRELDPSLLSMTPPVVSTPKPVKNPPVKKKRPEASLSPTVQENHQEQTVPVAPRDSSPAGDQDHQEVLHETPSRRILSPDYLSGQEYHDDRVENDEVAIEMPPEQPIETVIESVIEPPSPEPGLTRPRRTAKPNPKYSPEIYDVSYVGTNSRTRSRRSIRRAGK